MDNTVPVCIEGNPQIITFCGQMGEKSALLFFAAENRLF